MAYIQDEKQYKAVMARIDELCFSTDENTPVDDERLAELDRLSALVEEYEFYLDPPSGCVSAATSSSTSLRNGKA
jgi:antitoxin component HigA of HigAB toxin-antitoxin module